MALGSVSPHGNAQTDRHPSDLLGLYCCTMSVMERALSPGSLRPVALADRLAAVSNRVACMHKISAAVLQQGAEWRSGAIEFIRILGHR
jgi:hypothetical protein